MMCVKDGRGMEILLFFYILYDTGKFSRGSVFMDMVNLHHFPGLILVDIRTGIKFRENRKNGPLRNFPLSGKRIPVLYLIH